MGDSEEGGGGSVHWRLEAKKVDEGKANSKQVDKKVDQDGEDKDGTVGTDFTVTVLVPKNVNPDDFLKYLKDHLALTNNKKRVYFNHPIQEEEAQIRVSWGQSSNHEDNGGKPTKFPTPFPAGDPEGS